jgi:glycosyltransferase involved in cell wall biosynthesis
LREAGIPLHHIVRPRPRPDLLVRAALDLAPVLRRERIDVVHAHGPAAGAAAGLARRLARRRDVAVVTTYHGVPPERVPRAVSALRRSDVVVGVGPWSTRSLIEAGLPEELTATVYNAVSVRRGRPRDVMRAELGVALDAELVVNVGRYADQKNQLLLLDALARLAPSRPRLRALVVGTGDLQAALRARIDELGLQEVATLTGPRDDAVDVIAAADVFALTSHWEALPMVLLEAMGVGAAIATTDVGGVRDVIRDGETGLVVPPGDVVAVAAAVGRLLDDDPLRTRVAAAARSLVESDLSEEAMVEGYLRVYSDALSRRRTRASERRSGASPST